MLRISVSLRIQRYTSFEQISKSDENVYTRQSHPNLKKIGSIQTKQCIKAYTTECNESKWKRRAANNEQNNEQ